MGAVVFVKPLAVTDAMLIACNVPETDWTAWTSVPTYGLGVRVIVAATHSIYESQQAGNQGKDPTLAANSSWWARVGATNRWKPHDTSVSTQVAQAYTISYQYRPGVATPVVAALNMTNVLSMRVRMIDPVYGLVCDQTYNTPPVQPESNWWSWTYGARTSPTLCIALDLPSYPTADLYIDFTGGPDMAIGVIMFGQPFSFGEGVKFGARVGIKDYSQPKLNSFGDLVVVVGAFAKRANFDVSIDNDQLNQVTNTLPTFRGTPVLCIAHNTYEALVLYCISQEFEVAIPYTNTSDCSLNLLGLT